MEQIRAAHDRTAVSDFLNRTKSAGDAGGLGENRSTKRLGSSKSFQRQASREARGAEYLPRKRCLSKLSAGNTEIPDNISTILQASSCSFSSIISISQTELKLIIAAGGASEEGDDVEELAKKELSEFDMAEFDLDNDGQLSLSETMVRTIEFEKDEDQLNSWRA